MPERLSTLTSFISSFLRVEAFRDYAHNGLQVCWNEDALIKRILCTVDIGEDTIEDAASLRAELIISHHGLLWGHSLIPICGSFAKKIHKLAQNNISVYACHLPLDGHSQVGNAFQLAFALQLENCESWYNLDASQPTIGVRGIFNPPISYYEVSQRLSNITGTCSPSFLPVTERLFENKFSSVGIVTGSGTSCLEAAAKGGIELLITGELKQEAFHCAKDFNVAVLAGGHYATETWGVRALGWLLRKKFDLSLVFCDRPTGI
jgi:dinuclear metal center YbgI/SA1388 family protein